MQAKHHLFAQSSATMCMDISWCKVIGHLFVGVITCIQGYSYNEMDLNWLKLQTVIHNPMSQTVLQEVLKAYPASSHCIADPVRR